MRNPGLIANACGFHPWDAMAPAALSGILRRAPFRFTAETGCGGSTIVLSHASERHTTFAIEGPDRTISELRAHPDLRSDRVAFVEGETKETTPRWQAETDLDLVLLDGPHAYPLPQVELCYLFPRLRAGGWLVLDDLQIRSVHELFRFLRKEPSLMLEQVALRTAFFRRLRVEEHGPDGWPEQGINRRPVLRYSWRDQMRRWLGRG
jgi:Methyltransferase domain